MPISTLTGEELLTGLSVFMNDDLSSTTTSNGAADGSSLVDTYLRRFQDRRLMGRYVRVTESGSNQYVVRTIDTNTQSTGTTTLTAPFAAQVVSGIDYQIHRFDPAKKFKALDDARYDISDSVYRMIYDESLTSDGQVTTFAIPEGLEIGPIDVWVETPVACQNLIWNFLTNSIGDNLNDWTAVNCTPEIVNQDYTDLVIPKYDYASTKITVGASVAATYSQVVADMSNSITAAGAAGRQMSAAMWVYSEVSGRITISLTDDTTTTSSDTHAGNGWQLLVLEKDILGSNATTLTFRIDVSSGAAMTFSWNRAWLYFGNKQRVTENYYTLTYPMVRRDATTQHFTLPDPVQRGYQLRLVGKTILSALGTNISTQTTNTMEVTDRTSQILYAAAARLLLQWEGLTATDVPDIYARIAAVEEMGRHVRQFSQYITPRVVRNVFLR